MGFKRILIAVDDSRYSLLVTKRGFELSNLLNAEVALVYVIDREKAMGEIDANIYPKEALSNLKQLVLKTLKKLAVKYKGRNFVEMAPEGIPKKTILEISKSWKADLIIVGAHGKSGMQNLLMGSVSQYVTLHSKIPVLVVPSIGQKY